MMIAVVGVQRTARAEYKMFISSSGWCYKNPRDVHVFILLKFLKSRV